MNSKEKANKIQIMQGLSGQKMSDCFQSGWRDTIMFLAAEKN